MTRVNRVMIMRFDYLNEVKPSWQVSCVTRVYRERSIESENFEIIDTLAISLHIILLSLLTLLTKSCTTAHHCSLL